MSLAINYCVIRARNTFYFPATLKTSYNESVLIVFFAVSNTSSSTVPFTNDFLGYHLADLIDFGWSRQTEQVKMVALQSYRLVLRPLPPRPL